MKSSTFMMVILGLMVVSVNATYPTHEQIQQKIKEQQPLMDEAKQLEYVMSVTQQRGDFVCRYDMVPDICSELPAYMCFVSAEFGGDFVRQLCPRTCERRCDGSQTPLQEEIADKMKMYK